MPCASTNGADDDIGILLQTTLCLANGRQAYAMTMMGKLLKYILKMMATKRYYQNKPFLFKMGKHLQSCVPKTCKT